MVKVQIPLKTPAEDDSDGNSTEDDHNEVGIMSDSEESDVDDDIGDPDWEEVETKDRDGDQFPSKPGAGTKMSDLPANGVTISTIDSPDRPPRKRRAKAGRASDGQRGQSGKRDQSGKRSKTTTSQDMPTSDSGFRNHPLYVLEKHLLKFQGIYPPEVVPMGFFKDLPVYPRDCVQTLRSRESWLREARTVILDETAYKIVKARPKRDKYSGDLIRDLPLELFGEWQTKPYDPPQALDGKVPRNCYGNVDMYKECMLPKGCAWLKLPGLPRVANKLGIDCAAAVIGFDKLRGGYGAHPVMDGFIVCEEFADTLCMAWEEEQYNKNRKQEEKRQKRVWDNWRRLLKAAMIREKLRVKYKHS